MSAHRHTMFDDLPPALQAKWRENSAKGGRAARGIVKARAARIGWQKTPDRFKHRRQRQRRLANRPSGFMCTACGKWHDYPANMPNRVIHTCACGAMHTIANGNAKPRKGKA